MSKKPVCGDIFCGAGGMSIGFEQTGFDIRYAIDVDPIHTKTYSENFPDCAVINSDVSKVTGDEIHAKAGSNGLRTDVLIAGPPCQGFSLIGKRQVGDPRNRLLVELARLICEIKPKYFVVENVTGLVMGNARDVAAEFLWQIRRGGYAIVTPIQALRAEEFGIPQTRTRIFILGYEKGLPQPRYPQPVSLDPKSRPTVWDAIGDLPNVDEFEELCRTDVFTGKLGAPSEYVKALLGNRSDSADNSYSRTSNAEGLSGCRRTIHSRDVIRRFEATSPGSMETISRYYRLENNGLALTIRSGTGKERGSFTAPRPIHPIHPRCITVREAARLHSFPDWFQFHPTKWHGFRQVGNSVPPNLSRAIASSIAEALRSA